MMATVSGVGKVGEDEKGQFFEIERVIKYRWINRRKYAHIKWKGYPYRDATWEPVDEVFPNATAVIPKASTSGYVKKPRIVERIDGRRVRHGLLEYRARYKGINGPRGIKWMLESDVERKDLIEAYENQVANGAHDIPVTREPSVAIIEEETQAQPSQSGASRDEVGASTRLTPLESALKLELSTAPPIDRWSREQVRSYLGSRGFPEEAAKLYNEAIDGSALACISSASVLSQCGILLGPALKVFRLVKRMQNGQFD